MGRGRLRDGRPGTAQGGSLTSSGAPPHRRALRIGIDIRYADVREPGQQRYLWRLGAWLGAQGHTVDFLTVRGQPREVRAPASTTLHRLDGLGRTALRAHVRALELDVLLLNPERARRYRGLRPNLLRSGYGTEHNRQKLRSFRGPGEHALRSGLRLTPWVRAEMRWERAYYETRRPHPDVIAQSEYMKREILDAYSVPEDRVHVIHNAVDPDEFSPARRADLRDRMRRRWGVPEEALCLLFLGHNFRLKGLWEVLGALPRVAERGRPVHLLVAGRGTGRRQRAKARRLVERHGLEGRVVLAGPVETSLEALSAADALLHVTWHDSFGFVALEAMACGLPVVTTRYAGASELIEPGTSGYLVEPGEEGELVAAIDALKDDAERARIGAVAAAAAAAHDEHSNFERVLAVMAVARERTPGPVEI